MRGWCRLLAAAGILVLGGVAVAGQPHESPPAADRSADTLTMGSVTLHRCATAAPWCATIARPLDPSGSVPGTIPVYFEFWPHTSAGKPVAGTLVATEGGPGYPATESRDEYLTLFEPLRTTRDVVLMDNRGTGRSGAVNCKPLQTDPALTEHNVGQCGKMLGARASLYGTALAADDLAAVLQALGAGRVDLYGDSYGTFFAQVFAIRHAAQLRSLILDGAYPLDSDPWYPGYAPAMRAKFDQACDRSECRHTGGTTIEHVTPVLQALRQHPVAAEARDGDGQLRRFTADAAHLATVMFGSAPAYATLRETDAAARAYLVGDTAPLYRLMSEAYASVDSRDASRSAAAFSSGLAAAVTCGDAPQIFDMSYSVPARLAARDGAIAKRMRVHPDTYAPFTLDEYRRMTLDYAFIDECVRWPAMSPQKVQAAAALRSAVYPDVPALVVSGDLDNMTPMPDSARLARQFVRGHHVVVPNGFHVNALPHSRSPCPASIVRHFIETLDIGDTSCLQAVPEVRLLPRFARTTNELVPATATAGNRASLQQLKVVTAVVYTLGDALARRGSNTTGHAVGLRGGTVEIEAQGVHGASRLTLRDVRWTNDLTVSGVINHPGRSGLAEAHVTASGPGVAGEMQVAWKEGVPAALAQIHGLLDGVDIQAETAAP